MSDRSILLGVSSNCSDALDGRVFASIPLERETLECLKERTRCYCKAKQVYPDLYETYEFHSLPQWYETGKSQKYDEQADRDKLAHFSYDAELDEGESYDESRLAALDNLETQEIQWLVVPAEELPGEGNLRTECDQLVMSLRGATPDTVEIRWVCYMKHTDVELRTFDISSKEVDRWLAELETGDHHAEEASHCRPSCGRCRSE